MFEISNEELARRGITRKEFAKIERLKMTLHTLSGEMFSHLRVQKLRESIEARGWDVDIEDTEGGCACLILGKGIDAEGLDRLPGTAMAEAYVSALSQVSSKK